MKGYYCHVKQALIGTHGERRSIPVVLNLFQLAAHYLFRRGLAAHLS